MNNFWKSTGAIAAGFLLGAVLATGADFIFNASGLMHMRSFKDDPAWVILVVIFYRFVSNTAGSYVAARLAPANPMKHALIIGVIGTALAIFGAIVMWNQAAPWYSVSVILISIPSAWLGGKLFVRQHQVQ